MDFNFDEQFEHIWEDDYEVDDNLPRIQLHFMTIGGKQYTFSLEWNFASQMPLLSYTTNRGITFQYFLINGLSKSPTVMETITRIGFDTCTFERADVEETRSVAEILSYPFKFVTAELYMYEVEHGAYMSK